MRLLLTPSGWVFGLSAMDAAMSPSLVVLDLGNTSLKIAKVGQRPDGAPTVLGTVFRIAHGGLADDSGVTEAWLRGAMASALGSAPLPSLVVVAPEPWRQRILFWLAGSSLVRRGPMLAPGPLDRWPVQNAYRAPEKLGVDRLAAAGAAVRRLGAPCLCVNAGTAVTLDLVMPGTDVKDPRPALTGGAILPGLRTILLAMGLAAPALAPAAHEAEALFHRISIDDLPAVGRDTRENVLLGALDAWVGGITRGIDRLVRSVRLGSLPILVGGGDARLISTIIQPDITIEHPVIEGAAMFMQMQALDGNITQV